MKGPQEGISTAKRLLPVDIHLDTQGHRKCGYGRPRRMSMTLVCGRDYELLRRRLARPAVDHVTSVGGTLYDVRGDASVALLSSARVEVRIVGTSSEATYRHAHDLLALLLDRTLARGGVGSTPLRLLSFALDADPEQFEAVDLPNFGGVQLIRAIRRGHLSLSRLGLIGSLVVRHEGTTGDAARSADQDKRMSEGWRDSSTSVELEQGLDALLRRLGVNERWFRAQMERLST